MTRAPSPGQVGSAVDEFPYVGTDRRQPRAPARSPVDRTEFAWLALALVSLGLVLPMVLGRLLNVGQVFSVEEALRTAWAVLFVGAGLYRLIRWRLTGDSRIALLGCAQVCFGAVAATISPLATSFGQSSRVAELDPIVRLVAVAAAFFWLARAAAAPEVDAQIRPLRLVFATLILCVLPLVGCEVAAHLRHPLLLSDDAWFGVGLVCALGWAGFAGLAARRWSFSRDTSDFWSALALGLLGLAELLDAFAFVLSSTFVLYTTGLELVAGGLALLNAAEDLGAVFSADGNRLLSVTGALMQTERQLAADDEDRQERLHDARSVIAALKAASHTLERYDARLDDDLKRRLRLSLVSELSRLERLIDGRNRDPRERFDVSAAVLPLITAERENGLEIVEDLVSAVAVGRPLELATVVQNLLVNAKRYAGGSAVDIRVEADSESVRLYVEDRGPGVNPLQQERVFERGVRISPNGTPGSGLGLYLARRLMREMGGEIVLRDRAGGGTSFMLSLPAGSAEVLVDDDVEVAQVDDRLIH